MKKRGTGDVCRHGETCAMGPNETHVREILASADGKPLAAYDILARLSKKQGHSIAPPTVYRALKHLAAYGVVTRIESQNAYVLCQHPHETHNCLFFICRACGAATETPDDQISRLLRQEAKTLDFDIDRQILEIVGLCRKCTRKEL